MLTPTPSKKEKKGSQLDMNFLFFSLLSLWLILSIYFSGTCPIVIPNLDHSYSDCHTNGHGAICPISCERGSEGDATEFVCNHGQWEGTEPICSSKKKTSLPTIFLKHFCKFLWLLFMFFFSIYDEGRNWFYFWPMKEKKFYY